MTIEKSQKFTRQEDIFRKTLPLLFITFFSFIYYSIMQYDNLSLFEKTPFEAIIKASRSPFDYLLTLTLIPILLFISGFITAFTTSDFNNYSIEKKINHLFKLIPVIKIHWILYLLFFSILYAISLFFVCDLIIICISGTDSFQDIDFSTMELTQYLPNFNKNYSIFFVFFAFLFLLVFKSKERINVSYFLGFLLLPFLTHNIIYTKIYAIFHPIPPYLAEIVFLSEKDTLILNLLILLLSSIFAYSLFKLKDRKNIINHLLFLFTGYFLNIIITLLTLTFVFNLYHLDSANESTKNKHILINNIQYDYIPQNAPTYTSNKDNEKLDILINAYAGSSIHLSDPIFSELFSINFKGNHENSYQLFATIYNANSKIAQKNQPKIFEIIKNNNISINTAVKLIIYYAYYQSSPYEATQSAIQNVLDKNYQEAINNYIKFGLNSSIENKSLFAGNNITSIGFRGIPSYQDMISSIIYEGYATMDFNKIDNEQSKQYWIERLKSPNLGLSDKEYSENEFNELFSVFGRKHND